MLFYLNNDCKIVIPSFNYSKTKLSTLRANYVYISFLCIHFLVLHHPISSQQIFNDYFETGSSLLESKGSYNPITPGSRGYLNLIEEDRFKVLEVTPQHFSYLEDSAFFINRYKNIKILKIENQRGLFSKKDTTSHKVPKLRYLENIECVYLEEAINWNEDSLWHELLLMPNLKYLGIQRFQSKLKDSEKLTLLLSKMKGIFVSTIDFTFPDFDKHKPILEFINISNYGKNISEYLKTISQYALIKDMTLRGVVLDSSGILYLSKMKGIQSLRLNSIELSHTSHLIEKIAQLDSIRFLQLSFGQKTVLPDNIHLLKQVEKLHISGNHRIKNNVLTGVFSMVNLKELNISGFSDTLMSPKIGQLKNLEYLNWYYEGKTLPNEIGQLKHLKSLTMRFGKLKTLPKSIGKLSNLQTLDLTWNNIEELPKSIGKLKKLRFLHLDRNNIEILPEVIGNLSDLEQLELSSNFIRYIPSSIRNLTKLTKLRLDQNQIIAIPDEIGKLANLELLWLQNDRYEDDYFKKDGRKPRKNNDILTFPASLKYMTSLKDIRLAKNGNFSSDILSVISFMPQKFENIDLSECNISALPPKGYEKLRFDRLDLSKNKIEFIPEDFYKLDDFNSIDLRDNLNPFLDIYLESGTQLMVKGFEAGIFTLQDLKKRKDIVEALMSLSSRYHYADGKNPILTFYPLALEIDSAKATNLLDLEKYADALFEAGRYKECIRPYKLSIEKDLKFCVVFTNFMIPKLHNMANALLYTGDTLACLNIFGALIKRFDVPLHAEAGLLHKIIGQHEISDSLFIIAEEQMLKTINEENNTLGWWGNELSLLEIYLIADEKVKFTNYLIQLKSKSSPDIKSQMLLQYFILIKDAVSGKNISNEIQQLENQISSNEISFKNWNCRLVDIWSSNLDNGSQHYIKLLNTLICKEPLKK